MQNISDSGYFLCGRAKSFRVFPALISLYEMKHQYPSDEKGLPADVLTPLTWGQPLELEETEPWTSHQAGWKLVCMKTSGHKMIPEAGGLHYHRALLVSRQVCIRYLSTSSCIQTSISAAWRLCCSIKVITGGCRKSIPLPDKAGTETVWQHLLEPLRIEVSQHFQCSLHLGKM